MDTRFAPHNSHLTQPGRFRENDPQLRLLAAQEHIHQPAILRELPASIPGIYTLGGGRQVGKTTLLKLWMAALLERGIPAESIAYLTGELIDDHHTLARLLQDWVSRLELAPLSFLVIDEVTYIKNWDRAVKYAADAGLLERVALMLTGSDLGYVKEARMRFPGRRGASDRVDFELHPLSFREAVDLKASSGTGLPGDPASANPSPPLLDLLFRELDRYLLHRGFLTAINDMARSGRITPSTLATYSDWIRGDMLKRGKSEPYLREVIGAIVRRMGSQVSWNALARELSIDHPKTVAYYIDALVALDVVFVQPALLEHRLQGAPKKARKVAFTDPFIFHALADWLGRSSAPGVTANDPSLSPVLVEATVASHIRRLHPTYYIKAEGEGDVAYVRNERFWPIEVKWSHQIRPKDLKQIRKYDNARIWARTRHSGKIGGVPLEPLPLALYRLDI